MTHKKGGKKPLAIEGGNKAIHLTWLKAYLNIGSDWATWTYSNNTIIGTDIPKSNNIEDDLESRVMPILQMWKTRTRRSQTDAQTGKGVKHLVISNEPLQGGPEEPPYLVPH
jgi:hypothetical protein